MHHLSHEIILAGNGYCGKIGLRFDSLIEIVAQGCRHNLIGIDHQHPWTTCMVNGKLSGRFYDAMCSFGKNHDPTPIGFGYFERIIGAFHIANKHFIKTFYRFKHRGKMARCVIGVDHNCNPF